MQTLKVLELFGGIGACSNALKMLNIPFEIVDYVEIDKYAVKSFNAIYGTSFEQQDITTWNKDVKVDLILGGFPCQDISLAGKQKGIIKGETRSGLMYEMMRIVEKTKPKYVIAENVKNILSEKFRPQLEEYLCFLNDNGYEVTMDLLNAKDYDIPQNRERVFTVSILGNSNYEFPNGNKNDNNIKRLFNFSARQDCRVVYDCDGLAPTLLAGMGEGGGKVPTFIENENFEFPPKQELKLRLKDMLEDEVDEKYYISKASKIRKLTPKECWRLMGFCDEDFEKARQVNSDTQLYKQAGNSIVVNVLAEIFKNLLDKEVK